MNDHVDSELLPVKQDDVPYPFSYSN